MAPHVQCWINSTFHTRITKLNKLLYIKSSQQIHLLSFYCITLQNQTELVYTHQSILYKFVYRRMFQFYVERYWKVNKSVEGNQSTLCHHSRPSSIWRLLTTFDVKLPASQTFIVSRFTTSSNNINTASPLQNPSLRIFI